MMSDDVKKTKEKKKGRRSNDQILKDRALTAELYLKGWQQNDIASEIGVDPSTITRDLQAIRKGWLESAQVDYGEAKAKELAKLDRMEREAWDAWEASKRPSQSVTKYSGEGRDVAIQTTQSIREGNPKHLQTIQWCIDQRCKILGLIVTRHEVSGGDKPIVVSMDGMTEIFKQMRAYDSDRRSKIRQN